MPRALVVASLIVSLLTAGCATRQTWLRPGEDPDQLTAAIARRAQGADPVESTPEGAAVVGDCLKTGAKVGESCALISLAILYGCARGQVDQGSFGDAWDRIWSDD